MNVPRPLTPPRSATRHRRWSLPLFSAVALSCEGGVLDAGFDSPHGMLPIDERNPVILENDGGRDNWQGEMAIALAAAGRMTLVGIIVNASPYWPDIVANFQDWTGLVAAARASGISAPDPVESASPPLHAPASGIIEDTMPNNSPGAQRIRDTAHRLGRDYRPIVVATGGQLTDVADAYLIDHTIANLVVVVSSLGQANASTATVGTPNGDSDPWADAIVVARYHFVQVSAYYEQSQDVSDARVAQLPNDRFGQWINAKRPTILPGFGPSDQISVMAAVMPKYAQTVARMAKSGTASAVAGTGTPPLTVIVPALSNDASGTVWVVSKGDSVTGTNAFWQALTSL
jgi:hypothetical protein